MFTNVSAVTASIHARLSRNTCSPFLWRYACMPDKAASVLRAQAKKGDPRPPRSHRRAASLCDKSMRRSLQGRANSLCFAASSAGSNESAGGRYARSSFVSDGSSSKRSSAPSSSRRVLSFGGCLPTTHRSSVFAVAKSSASRIESTATTGAAPKSCTVTRSRHRHTVVRRDAYAVNARETPTNVSVTERSAAFPKPSSSQSPKRSGTADAPDAFSSDGFDRTDRYVGDAATYAASENSRRAGE